MRKEEITCTVCPAGCLVTVCGEAGNIVSVEGATCLRGKAYAESEFVCPVRILTGTVRVEGAAEPLLAVRSSKPLPRKQLLACMGELRKVRLRAPVKMHEVVIADILGTGADIIATAGRK